MLDLEARRARHYAKLGARRRARKAAWKASGGDHAKFTEIMRGHVATGYAFYYDEPMPRPPHNAAPAEIWRTCMRRVAAFTVWYGIMAATVFVLGWIGYL
ncbi:MAG: hypothetical protein ACRDNL_15365 [Spirillospora sp.]